MMGGVGSFGDMLGLEYGSGGEFWVICEDVV